MDSIALMLAGICRRLKVPVPVLPDQLSDDWISDALSRAIEPYIEEEELEQESADAFFGALTVIAEKVKEENGS